jgi:hypothetical protein
MRDGKWIIHRRIYMQRTRTLVSLPMMVSGVSVCHSQGKRHHHQLTSAVSFPAHSISAGLYKVMDVFVRVLLVGARLEVLATHPQVSLLAIVLGLPWGQRGPLVVSRHGGAAWCGPCSCCRTHRRRHCGGWDGPSLRVACIEPGSRTQRAIESCEERVVIECQHMCSVQWEEGGRRVRLHIQVGGASVGGHPASVPH